jgi:hypothetical protein
MKKALIAIAILIGVITLMAFAGSAYAQTTQPPESKGEFPYGMGRHGMWNGERGQMIGGGVLHDYMTTALAEELNLTVDELQARLDDGERVIDIAIDQGLTLAEFRDMKETVRMTAIENALADGVITQEQADLMKARPAFGNGLGRGMRGGFGGNCPGATP